jgi:hypothetical protein
LITPVSDPSPIFREGCTGDLLAGGGEVLAKPDFTDYFSLVIADPETL